MKSLMVGMGAALAAIPLCALTLDEGFRAPPNEAKPQTWYHMMNGNVTKEGVTRDFEAMAAAGLGGMQIFAVGCAIPGGPVSFDSPEWHDIMRHAHCEAKRLGLEMCILNCAGWSNSGGPWLKAEDGMKETRFTETAVKGPSRFSGVLPRTDKDNGFYADIAVLAYPTPAKGLPLSSLTTKVGLAKATPRGRSDMLPHDLRPRSAAQIVAKDKIIDLTDRMKPDGRLEWDVPAGEWTILRMGYVCNGHCNVPAPKGGRGFEVDKLSAGAMDRFFEGYVGRVCRELGVKPGEPAPAGLRAVLIDSYEVGCQNWTQDFDKTFEKRMGYSIRPYLPVIAGRIVGSAEESERVLEDFRRVIADLFAENYAGRFAKLCREHGLVSYIEPYYGCNSDDLQYGQDAAVPMAEFWSMARDGDHAGNIGNARLAASLAHVWGRRFAATESFTAGPPSGGQWLTTPFSIKNQGDRVFASGVNRIVFHTYTHQPWADVLPGMTMGRWGIHLSRNQTWWHLAPCFFRYQARCQWMLQEGTYVADALVWTGEAAPNGNEKGNPDVGLPNGYDRDACATKAVEMLTVRNGKVVVPGGVEYSILVLPNTDAMSGKMVRRIGELVDAGARVVSLKRPTRSIGLSEKGVGPQEYKALVDLVWAKGVMECPVAAALLRLGVAPDFTSTVPDTAYIHRRDKTADWYFVARNNVTPSSFEVSFRISGRQPEIWDAVTGEMRPADEWREENGRTYVTLHFKPSGSAFVVFRDKAASSKHVVKASVAVTPRDEKVVRPNPQPPPTWEWRDGHVFAWQPLAATLAYSDGTTRRVAAEPPAAVAVDGAWDVSFPAGYGAPESVEFQTLKSWTDFSDVGIRYFSGTATYRKRIAGFGSRGSVLKPGARLMLDLGEVRNFAEVTVNGRKFPALWQPPYRLDITDAVADANGALDVEVKVTNLWPNRLIGDDTLFAPDCEWSPRKHRTWEWGIKNIPKWVWEGKKSPTGRLTFTTWRHWSKQDAPLASGLIGPVRLRFAEKAK